MGTTPRPVCRRCESLPEVPSGAGRIFLWPPLGHTVGKLERYLAGAGRSYQSRGDIGALAVSASDQDIDELATGLLGTLTGEEARATRALFKPAGDEPQLGDFAQVGPLSQLLATLRSRWLVEMLGEQRLTSHFQPIVHARDTSRIYAYEALMRGRERDGSLVSPGRMLDLARSADLLFQLDLAARLSAVREASRLGLQLPIFINFTPTAIYDPAFCLRSTIAAISAQGMGPERVVFELIESDHAADVQHLRSLIGYYRQAGFRVALDDLGAGYSSLNLLHQLRPDILKLDMELVRGIHEDPYKASITQKVVELARELGVVTVAEGIETLEELRWVRAHGVDLVQGYLIARPQSPPPSTTLALPE